MMQVTGNKSLKKQNILSIRLSPSGLYFSINDKKPRWIEDKLILKEKGRLTQILEENKLSEDNFSRVSVGLCTKDTVLIPSEHSSIIEDLNPKEGYKIIEAMPCAGIIEIIYMPKHIKSALKEFYADKVNYVSSLLRIRAQSNKKTYSLAVYGDMCSLVASEGAKVLMAQNLPCQNYADIVYYMSVFESESKANLELVFDSTGGLYKQIKAHYKKIKNR
ncbi:MAG: DUF3822 family protein [Rikenellaceae bacterium]